MSTITQKEPAAIKSSSGLRVLITGSIMELFLGILYIWSIFVSPVSEVYSWHISSVKLTSSFMLCFFVVGIIAGGKLHIKIGSDKVVLIGGLMLSFGMLATGFLPNETAWLMYISYGIIGGFGVGSGYNAIICAAQKWFPHKRGLATGIVVSAFGLSTVVFAPLIEALIRQFELRNTFIILGAIFFIVTVALFRFIRLPDEDTPALTPSAAMLAKRQYTVTEALKTREFYLIACSLMLVTATFFILNPSFKTYAAARGVGSFGTMIVMMTGVANACGRLLVPVLSDKIGREQAALSVILVTALCAVLLCFVQGFLFIAVVLLIAFCFGGLPGVYSVLAADYFGIKNAGANYGAIMCGFAVSALCFPLFIGLLPGDTIKFITLAGLGIIGVILMLILIIMKKKKEVAIQGAV